MLFTGLLMGLSLWIVAKKTTQAGAAKDEEEKTKTTGHHWNSDSDADPDSKSKTAKPQSSRVFWTRRRYQRQPALNGNKNSGKLDV